MVNLRQKELFEWEKRNFGEQSTFHSLAGMTEELGELAHFLLKAKQGIREGVNGLDLEMVGDAFADVFIYGINLMSKLGIDAELVLDKTISEVLKRDWKKNPYNGLETMDGGIPPDPIGEC